ncbi:hypothetical protein LTR95_003384 [Oleoguttula sp. CCFEE 5521]
MSYRFKTRRFLEKTLIAGDSNSDDREGHRGMAQLGDSWMGTVIYTDGMERGLTRRERQDACSQIRSKTFCARIAKGLRLHEWIRTSERQVHEGIQLTTLENAVAALVGAVWLDSHDYGTVVRVMIAIGLLNHVRYTDEMQETLLMDMDLELNVIAAPAMATGLGDKTHNDADYWSLLTEDNSDLDDLFRGRSMHSLSPIVGLASSPRTEGTPEYTPWSSLDRLTSSDEHEQQAPQNPDTWYGGTEASATPYGTVQELAEQVRPHSDAEQPAEAGTGGNLRGIKHNARRRTGRRVGRPGAESTACLIAAYVNHEREKNTTSHERTCVINAMEAYQIAILRTPASCQQSLAISVTSIGDGTSLLLLKEAIQGLRSPQVGHFLCVDRQMPILELLQMVKKLGCCTALLKLVRWLHVVTLWEDLSQQAGDGANGFVLATPDSFTQFVAKKGNPRYLARSEITEGLSAIRSSELGSLECKADDPSPRLRRLGQRLSLMIRRWGQGILLILGQALSDSRITTPTDRTFESLLALIHEREGVQISAVSAAAHSIVQDFRHGNQSAARLRLEVADEDAIFELPRLSSGFQTLLAPLDKE